MKIYMAGPLFTAAERQWNRELRDALVRYGYSVVLPQELEGNVKEFDAGRIFRGDVLAQKACQVTLAWLEGPDPDSGTCWEVATALRLMQYVIGYTTDLRWQDAENGPYDMNLMLTQSVHQMLRFSPDTTPSLVAEEVHKLLWKERQK